MRDMMKPAIVLLIICLIVGLSLAAVNSVTKDVIKDRAAKDAEDKRKEVMQQAEGFEKLEGWKDKAEGAALVKEAYKALISGKTAGFVFNVSPKGYAGNIEITVGINTEGKITGVKIGEHKETPGLGSKASEPAFINQFKNKGTEQKLGVVKKKPSNENEIEAISGATITSRAVTQGVNAASELAKVLLKEGAGE
ncbi:MAG: RnfABCDGE type electron transport complex subunit G [Clostridia bacterium]|nr:RnfABCDGE type electron transport complex subunit G [Clostridia bacterium]